jgi:hypothetical protein
MAAPSSTPKTRTGRNCFWLRASSRAFNGLRRRLPRCVADNEDHRAETQLVAIVDFEARGGSVAFDPRASLAAEVLTEQPPSLDGQPRVVTRDRRVVDDEHARTAAAEDVLALAEWNLLVRMKNRPARSCGRRFGRSSAITSPTKAYPKAYEVRMNRGAREASPTASRKSLMVVASVFSVTNVSVQTVRRISSLLSALGRSSTSSLRSAKALGVSGTSRLAFSSLRWSRSSVKGPKRRSHRLTSRTSPRASRRAAPLRRWRVRTGSPTATR